MSDLWLGLLLSIPVGIVINLISGPIGRKLSDRNRAASEKQSARNAAFLERAQSYAKNRTAMYSFLLEALVRIAWIGALFGVLTGLLSALGQAMNADATIRASEFTNTHFLYGFASIIFIISQMVALLGVILVLNISRDALITVRKVRQISNEL